jgi:hypothetical protein
MFTEKRREPRITQSGEAATEGLPANQANRTHEREYADWGLNGCTFVLRHSTFGFRLPRRPARENFRSSRAKAGHYPNIRDIRLIRGCTRLHIGSRW